MIEAEIEGRICEALERAIGGSAWRTARSPEVRGLWRDAADVRRGPELGQAGVVADVTVSPRAFGTFGIGTCSMDVTIELSVRIDLCPAEASLETYAGPIADLLQEWNRTMDCAHPCGLAVEGEFQPGGLNLRGGEGPTLDREAGVWSVTFAFTLIGVAGGNEQDS